MSNEAHEIDEEAVLNNATLIFTTEEVSKALDSLAAEVSAVIDGKDPIVLCVMNGGLIFTAHLLIRMNLSCQLDYIHATRYREQTSGSDELIWKAVPQQSLKDRVVLVCDDILDEGHTLDGILEYCLAQGASHVYSAVLLDKTHERRKPGVMADFCALHVDDRYVFGFGMDYKGYLRNVNGIYAID